MTIAWEQPPVDEDKTSKITGFEVERKDLVRKDDNWTLCTCGGLSTPEFTIGGLEENHEYTFRVRAKNAVGSYSAYSEASDPAICRNEHSRPRIELCDVKQNEIVLKPGLDLIIKAEVHGEPTPEVVWHKNGEKIDVNVRTNFDTDESGSATLKIVNVSKADSGKYSAVATNNLGQDQTDELTVKALGSPNKPENLVVSDVTPKHATVTWQPPLEDGGSPVVSYTVDMRESNKSSWLCVSQDLRDSKIKLKLTNGKEYYVRVSAANQYGVGEAQESHKFMAKVPYGSPGKPAAPVVGAVTSDTCVVTWNKPTEPDVPITSYILEKKDIHGTRWTHAADVDADLDCRHRFTKLREGSQLEFRVIAKNVAGTSEPSQSTGPVTIEQQSYEPSEPQDLKLLETTESSATMSFHPPMMDGGKKITKYVIEYKLTSSEEDSWFHNQVTVSGLIENEEYSVRLAAVNEVGQGKFSSLSDTIVPRKKLNLPDAELEETKPTIKVKAEKSFSIRASFKGTPTPKVIVKKDGVEVDSSKVEIDET